MANERRVETASKRAVRERNYRRARERALTRLANAHPEHYKELFERESLNDEILGKKWINIDGDLAPIPTSIESSDSSEQERADNNKFTEAEGESR
jgi:hypothetical protein